QAGLDVAIELGIPHGGWIPKGRRTEAGILPAKYRLKEIPTASYPKRTEKNVIESDGTIIFSHGTLTSGSALTRRLAKKHHRPWLYVDLDKYNTSRAAWAVKDWLIEWDIKVLNVAGSSESKAPGIYEETKEILEGVFDK
ncbi:MAG: hypothetical protein GY950_16145, partial [bacterium]|nr:hypothetical protein [bacterium]